MSLPKPTSSGSSNKDKIFRVGLPIKLYLRLNEYADACDTTPYTFIASMITAFFDNKLVDLTDLPEHVVDISVLSCEEQQIIREKIRRTVAAKRGA